MRRSSTVNLPTCWTMLLLEMLIVILRGPVLEGTLRRLGCRISFLSIRLCFDINDISSCSRKLPTLRATLLRGGDTSLNLMISYVKTLANYYTYKQAVTSSIINTNL